MRPNKSPTKRKASHAPRSHTTERPHAHRALWKGAISFGLVHIPIEVFPAEARHELDFTMLDKRDFAPVGYKRYNKNTGDELDMEHIVKGYEYEKGEYVVLSDEDFRRANVEATQTVEIVRFVPPEQIPVVLFDTPYYLAPSARGEKVYALLRETLREAGKVAIAQVVIRSRQHLAVLIPQDRMLLMNTLRYASEIRALDQFELPAASVKQAGIKPQELEMALQLVERMSGNFKPDAYHDTYRDDLLARIQHKVDAGETKVLAASDERASAPASSNVVDLMPLLRRSLAPNKKTDKPEAASPTPRKRKVAAPSAPRRKAARAPARKRA